MIVDCEWRERREDAGAGCTNTVVWPVNSVSEVTWPTTQLKALSYDHFYTVVGHL